MDATESVKSVLWDLGQFEEAVGLDNGPGEDVLPIRVERLRWLAALVRRFAGGDAPAAECEPKPTRYALGGLLAETRGPRSWAEAEAGGAAETWAVVDSVRNVWNERDGLWEWEPQPSDRTDEFLARTRYPKSVAVAILRRLATATAGVQDG
jgi:hypothetical protein